MESNTKVDSGVNTFHRIRATARRSARVLLLAGVTVLTGACDSSMSSMSDSELQDKSYECKTARELSPGAAIACDNYSRECARRRKEGRFVC